MALRKISTIVESVLLDIGENTKTNLYPRFLNWALKAVREINYDIVAEIKTVKLTVLPNNTVPFPDDYVNYCRLFILKENRVFLLSKNNEIPLFDEQSNNQTTVYIDRNPNVRPNNYFYNRDRNGYNIDETHYGFGNGHNPFGHYRIDNKKQRFVFDSNFTEEEIVLEYITNGLECNELTMVDELAENYIKEYVRYMYLRMDKTTKSWQMAHQERMYLNALRQYKERKHTPTISEFLDVLRQNTYQAPKT